MIIPNINTILRIHLYDVEDGYNIRNIKGKMLLKQNIISREGKIKGKR